ncbi:MAG: carnitine dehydratase [Bradyrhizobium sp.]|nr:carnitine dehydratase [Bradyrhizobium sp.]
MKQTAQFQNIVDGQSVDAARGDVLESFDPATGEPWATIPRCTQEDVEAAVGAARRAFQSPDWRGLTPSARGLLLYRFADLLEGEVARLAALETRDNGKLIAEMSAQLGYLPAYYRYFAGLADKIEGAVLPIDKPAMHAFTRRQPIGVIACITPWNSPLLLLAWKLAPLLAAGNTAVIKPSEHASCSTLAFAELFARAGFPSGVVNTVTGLPAEAGIPLVAHPDVAKIAFTGGEAGGIAVYRSAAENLKKVTLELGGKSPNIIFGEANLDRAVMGAISGIFAASGQTCIAGSRLLVQRTVHDEVVDRLVGIVQSARIGDPKLADTQVGPVTTRDQRAKILDHISRARASGAECVVGGGTPQIAGFENGWFVEPTIFTRVDNGMPLAREEVFGPVLAVIPFDDEDEALAIANDSPFGLAAGVWTSDIGRALRMSERLEAGTVWVNTYRVTSFMAPFGGVKRSGIGRESGQIALNEYLEEKTVWIDMGSPPANPFVIRS